MSIMLRTILLEPLLNLLLLFYALIPGSDFGLAVIAMTAVVRLLMWPLVKKQMHHSKTMRELQPEIDKVKKKAKGDKQKESQMMVELFKEKEINPFGSIGLALVQFPILIALFFVLRDVVTGDVAASTYGFIQDMPAIQSILSNPEAFDPTLFGYFHMADPSIPLALVAGAFQYFQAKQIAPQQSGDDAASKMSGNMVKIFPVITVIVGSTLPSALVLYWGTSSIIAVLQQHLILQSEVSLMQRLKPGRTKNQNDSEPKDSNKSKQTTDKPKADKSKSQTKKQTNKNNTSPTKTKKG